MVIVRLRIEVYEESRPYTAVEVRETVEVDGELEHVVRDPERFAEVQKRAGRTLGEMLRKAARTFRQWDKSGEQANSRTKWRG